MSQRTDNTGRQGGTSPGRILILCASGAGRPHWVDRLELAGYQLSIQHDRSHIREDAADLLIIDFTSLGAGSLALAREARDQQHLGIVPILGITEGEGISSRLEALRAGVDTILEEPIHEEELLALVQVRMRCREEAMTAVQRQKRTNEIQCQLTEFLVHDLKNPLATILTNLHLLEGRIDTDVPKRLAMEARAAGRRLERMLVNMLDLSYREAGRLELEPVVVRLDDFVEEAVFAVRPLGAPHGISVEPDLGKLGAETVEVDFDMMTRVLINLLENAVRHSPKEATVTVRTVPGDGFFLLCVDDVGEGVPECDRDRIFDKFVRINTDVQKRARHGLGLAFVRMVAEAHELEIGVDRAPHGGGRFFIKFPLAE